jgi:hypothetical protein
MTDSKIPASLDDPHDLRCTTDFVGGAGVIGRAFAASKGFALLP